MKRSRLARRTRLQRRTQLRQLNRLHRNRQRRDWPKVRAQVAERADGWCEARIEGVCTGRGHHAHHILRRAQGGPDTPENLLWLCAACHGHIHANPAWSYEQGFLQRSGVA